MRFSLLIFIFILFNNLIINAQTSLSWKQLADVTFELKYFKEHNMKFLVPTFGKTPKVHEGKEVAITGYMLPLDPQGKVYALSKNPYAACFFCGAAGPETVVELQLKPEAIRRYKMDEWLTFKGILALNNSDVNHFNYILKDATLQDK